MSPTALARQRVSPTVLLAHPRLSAISRWEKPCSFSLSTSVILRTSSFFLGTMPSRSGPSLVEEGYGPKSGAVASVGVRLGGGRFQPECPADFNRNRWPE